jgi:hypothetical protein
MILPGAWILTLVLATALQILANKVTAWFTNMFCNFYLVKNHTIAKISTTTKAREKISTDLESLEF